MRMPLGIRTNFFPRNRNIKVVFRGSYLSKQICDLQQRLSGGGQIAADLLSQGGEGRGGRLRRRWGSQGGSRRCCCGRCRPAAPLAPSSNLAATPPLPAPCCSSSRANWARWKRLMSLMLMAPLIEGDVDVPLLHFLRAHQRNDAFN